MITDQSKFSAYSLCEQCEKSCESNLVEISQALMVQSNVFAVTIKRNRFCCTECAIKFLKR